MDDLELLEAPARADRDAGERRLRQLDRHLRLVAQPLLETAEQRAAACEDDPTIHDVRRELGRRLVERRLDRVEDLPDGLVESAPHFLGCDHDRLGQACEHVAASDLRLHLLAELPGGADLELQLLRGLLADEEFVLLLDVAHDRLVHLVTADADRLGDDDAAEGDDRDFGSTPADVHDHVPGGLGDGQAGPYSSRHRLLDQIGLASARGKGRLLDGAFLDSGHARGDAHDDARMREPVVVHLLDEVAEHLLGDVEVGDDPVLQRPDGGDRSGRASEHALGLDPDGVDLTRALVDRDDARLGEDDASAADVDERVGSPEIDCHLPPPEPAQCAPKTHERASLVDCSSYPKPYVPAKRPASRRIRSAPGRPTTFR